MNEHWTEKLIDTHLEAPNTAEPSLGFESRLLAQVAERRTTKRRPVFWMIWAPPALTAAIVAIVFFTRLAPQKPALVETAKVTTPQPASSMVSPKVRIAKVAAHHSTLHRVPSSQQNVIGHSYPDQFFSGAETAAFFQVSPTSASAFPSASPLTGEEQMLLTMVWTMPSTQQRALVEALEASRIPDAEPGPVPESSLRPASEIKNTH